MKSEVQEPCPASLHVHVTPQEPLEDSLRILTDLVQVSHHVGDFRLLSFPSIPLSAASLFHIYNTSFKSFRFVFFSFSEIKKEKKRIPRTEK